MDDVTALPETMLDVLERRAAVAPQAEFVRCVCSTTYPGTPPQR
ncbi:hypothetical protein AB0F17_00395 [Nonomuraea sp. NPDC026600]